MSHTRSVAVKRVIGTFCPSFEEQVAARVYFYKSSRLVSRGVIRLTRAWSGRRGKERGRPRAPA